MGKGVFIGPESSRRPAKVAYVRYLSTAVQRLSRTSRYYPKGIPKSSVRPVLFDVCPQYYSQSTVVLFTERTSALKDSSIRPAFQRTSTLKDKSIRPPTLAYVRSRGPIPQNALLTDPSDPKSKLTLLTKPLMLS
jgi:hypothetical protein